MAFRTWGRLLLTALGVSVLAGAGQLGIAYGFGIVRLTGAFTDVNRWPAQLAWVGWFAMTAAVAGAVVTGRLARRDGLPDGTGVQLAISGAAALGAVVVAPLCMQPARAAELSTIDPVWAVGICAVVGAAVGAAAASAVLLRPPLGWNVAMLAAAVWVVALVSAAPTLLSTGQLRTVRLGVLEPTWLDADTAQRLAMLLLPAVALLAGAVTGGLARWRGEVPLIAGAAGAAGPVLLAFAYLTAGPGDSVDRYQLAPYYGAVIAVAAGALGSAAATLLRWPLRAARADDDVIAPTDILAPLPAGPEVPAGTATGSGTTVDLDRPGAVAAGSGTVAAGSGTLAAGSGTLMAGSETLAAGSGAPSPAHWDWPGTPATPAPGPTVVVPRGGTEPTVAAGPPVASGGTLPDATAPAQTATTDTSAPTTSDGKAAAAAVPGPAVPGTAATTRGTTPAQPTSGGTSPHPDTSSPSADTRALVAPEVRTPEVTVPSARTPGGAATAAPAAGPTPTTAPDHPPAPATGPGHPPAPTSALDRPPAPTPATDDAPTPVAGTTEAVATGRTPADGSESAPVGAAEAAATAPKPRPRRTRKPRSAASADPAGTSGAPERTPPAGSTPEAGSTARATAADTGSWFGRDSESAPTDTPSVAAGDLAEPVPSPLSFPGSSRPDAAVPADRPRKATPAAAVPAGQPRKATPAAAVPADQPRRTTPDDAGTPGDAAPAAGPVRPRHRAPLPDLGNAGSWNAFGAAPTAGPAASAATVPAAGADLPFPDTEPASPRTPVGIRWDDPAPTGAGQQVDPAAGTADGAPGDTAPVTGKSRGRRSLFRRKGNRAGEPVAGTPTGPKPLAEQDEEFVDWVTGLSRPLADNEPETESGRRSLRSSGRHHRD